METATVKGGSRKKAGKGRQGEEKKLSHFRTAGSGGYEETQIICYLWDIVKELEAERNTGAGSITEVEKQIRRQIRVEMRRYFAHRKHRNTKLIIRCAVLLLGAVCLFGFIIGIDHVSGSSMYPYLNHGDWIVYSRLGRVVERDQVLVFEKNGESLVKRVAGLPGDTVEISASGEYVAVNGVWVGKPCEPLTELSENMGAGKAADKAGITDTSGMGVPLTVMDRQYFVLGDNRAVSIDSRDRTMGTVPAEDVLGKVVLVIRLGG